MEKRCDLNRVLGYVLFLTSILFLGCGRGHQTNVEQERPRSNTEQTESAANAPESTTPTSYVQAVGKNGEYQQKLDTLLDPTQTGWSTEAINDAAGKRLKKLAKLIEQAHSADPPNTSRLLSDDFRCSPLRPELNEVYQSDSIQVFRQANANEGLSACTAVELESQLRRLRSAGVNLPLPASDDSDYHVKFKIVSVNRSSETISTDAYVEGSGQIAKNQVQWRANWNLSWKGSLDDLRIATITVNDYEETLSQNAQPW
ncbi:MAG: hypothetical protein AAF497_24205, partial [Planctomycetota bacterium]